MQCSVWPPQPAGNKLAESDTRGCVCRWRGWGDSLFAPEHKPEAAFRGASGGRSVRSRESSPERLPQGHHGVHWQSGQMCSWTSKQQHEQRYSYGIVVLLPQLLYRPLADKLTETSELLKAQYGH